MVTILPMQNKNFSGDPEEPNEVPGADEETKSHLHWQFLGIWQVLQGIILEALFVNTTQIRNKCDYWKSSAQSERRDICGTVAIRSGQWMVGGFYGVLLLSAKYSGSFIWWEDTVWKAVRNTIYRTSNTVWSNGSNITLFLRKTYRDCISLEQKSCQIYSSVMHFPRGESGRETSWSQTLKNWRRWTHLISTPEGSMRRKC